MLIYYCFSMKNYSSHHTPEEISVINYFADNGYIWAVKTIVRRALNSTHPNSLMNI